MDDSRDIAKKYITTFNQSGKKILAMNEESYQRVIPNTVSPTDQSASHRDKIKKLTDAKSPE